MRSFSLWDFPKPVFSGWSKLNSSMKFAAMFVNNTVGIWLEIIRNPSVSRGVYTASSNEQWP